MLSIRTSIATFALAVLGCSQTPPPQATRSLRASSDVGFICAGDDGGGALRGRPLDACPDYVIDGEDRRLLALALQKETGEVAVVDMSTCREGGPCAGRVRDLERTQPGVNFLPVGAEPVSVASTPGGAASFVAVAEPGREGIFALPTSCLGARPEAATYRDLRTWPACRLPAFPGQVQILVDAARDGDCAGETDSEVDQSARECPADLSAELGKRGRRKLVVTLPGEGELLVMDAQRLLDLHPGSFDPCPIEARLPLQVQLPEEELVQELPGEWEQPDSCSPPVYRQPAAPSSFGSWPSDFALDEQRLYVADSSAPVVHVLDVSDACAMAELEPLLPASYTRPGSVVTTRRLAVSPETSTGQKFVYAVDGSESPTAGSLMVFDVSPGATQRTPLLRPRSDFIAQEPPDRIQFDQEVRDIEFAFHDFPEPDESGVAFEGLMCEPDPDRSGALEASYRPNSDGTGASPGKLRGVFGFAALQSGFVTVIDVEDLDAPCRRPADVNAGEQPDIRGCSNDAFDGRLEEPGGTTATVSDESSCHVVVPHRARAASFYNSEIGGTLPFVRSFPQLRAADGTSLAVDQTERGRDNPRLLGVNYGASDGAGRESSGDAEVLVGATTYRNHPEAPDRLMLDPALSERNSLVLPHIEPRAHAGLRVNTVTFEGVVRGSSDAPFDMLPAEAASELGLSGSYGVFAGGVNSKYCTAGIEDEQVMRQRGQEMLSQGDDALLDQFGERYGDYVDIIDELADPDDEYWDSEPGRSCGEEYLSSDQELRGHAVCELFFGSVDLPDRHRELRIVRAYNDRLVVEPRIYSTNTERRAVYDMVECCFPGGVEFYVRASQHWVRRQDGELQHGIVTNDETLACERDCSFLSRHLDGRAFEMSCDGPDCGENATGAAVVGPSDYFDEDDGEELANELTRALACRLDAHPGGGVQPGAPGSECIFDSLTARFVIYRGLAPSERDMTFTWNTVGGFVPLSVDLFSASSFRTTTMPQRMVYVPQIDRLVIADGGSTGLAFVGLRGRSGGPGLLAGVAF